MSQPGSAQAAAAGSQQLGSRGAAAPGALARARELPAHMVGAAYHVSSCLIALGREKNALCACSVLLPRESGACGCHGGFETINK